MADGLERPKDKDKDKGAWVPLSQWKYWLASLPNSPDKNQNSPAFCAYSTLSSPRHLLLT